MKTTIFLPEKIKVGYQERSNTYTKKLAYIIYYDEKGKLRKETSWNSWRDNKIDFDDFDNEPLEGFVLNKKVGDYVSDWNHRQAYVRVYDPRGFEFEITIENLLYVLENTNSIKGKGLEGQFIYGWDGKELVLIPTESPDYIEIKNYADTVKENYKLKAKELIVGATYLTKDKEEWVYLGRFDKWETDYDNKYENEKGKTVYPNITKGKTYYFYNKSNTSNWRSGIENIKSFNKFIALISPECDHNYAEMFDKLERDTNYSPVDDSKNEYVPYTYEEFIGKFSERSWSVEFYTSEGEIVNVKREGYGNSNENLKIERKVEYARTGFYGGKYNDWKYEYEPVESLEKLFKEYPPHYLNKYLANGKLYSEGK